MSAISKTTLGGADFELLCRGNIRTYSFNPADLSSEMKVEHIEKKLIQQLEETVGQLEFHSDREIAKIYIGKTFIHRRKRPGGFVTFDPLDHHTWRKNGISSRWGEHKHHDYGRDGLVVLGAITRQTMPEKCRSRVHQEDFALAMEQKLLHHYLLSEADSRVVNDTFTAGKLDHGNSFAYAVYMAFSYEDSSTSTDTVEEGNSLQDDVYSPLLTRAQSQSNPTHSQSSNLDQEGHQCAENMAPVSPNPKLYRRLSSDCIITAQFSGTQSDPRSRRRPANPPTSTHQPHPYQQVANTPSHTSPPPYSPPSPSPRPTRRKQPRSTNNPIMQRFLNSLETSSHPIQHCDTPPLTDSSPPPHLPSPPPASPPCTRKRKREQEAQLSSAKRSSPSSSTPAVRRPIPATSKKLVAVIRMKKTREARKTARKITN